MAKWKPIQLDGSLFTNGQMKGLIGIEELIDSNCIVENDKKSKKNRKRKCSEDSDNETLEPNCNEKPKSEKKRKRKRKKKNKYEASVKKLLDSSIEGKEKLQNNQDEVILRPSLSGGSLCSDIESGVMKQTKKVNNKKRIEVGASISNGSNKSISIDQMQAWSIVDLPQPILKALAEQGFEKPTEIQELTLPPAILGRRDILGAAETGSGKTLAFALPILAGILKLKENNIIINNTINNESSAEESDMSDDENNEENEMGCIYSEKQTISKAPSDKPLYALILTPTRELAVQIKNHIICAAKYANIQVAVVLGGVASVKQERILSKGPEIVVATPGRLWELIQEGNSHLSQVDNIRYLAIDETDRMLEKGHFQELHQLLERINLDDEKKKLRQNFVFSATLTLVHELPKYLANKVKLNPKSKKYISKITPKQKLEQIVELLGITNPKIVDITQESGTASTLTECRITCDFNEKDYYVYYFLQKHPGRTLIFCNSIGCVKRLATLFGLLGCNALPLHAQMIQKQRLKNLERFRDNPTGVLIATDVAARGLDIPCVEHVLHYQTPRTSESYVHRSGRTARASKEGITVLLMEPSEIQNYLKLCRTLGRTQDLPIFPIHEDALNSVKKRVNLAREVDKLELQVRKTNAETGWLEKAANDMDIIIDDFQPQMKEAKQTSNKIKKTTDIKRKQLADLLAKPLFPKGFSMKYPLSSGEINIPMVQGEQKQESAVELMKNTLENFSKKKKRHRPLFKSKVNGNVSKVKDLRLNKANRQNRKPNKKIYKK